jgi:MoaA/NifB/PqqE/SkfB family radical SAM enzyme
MVRVEKIKNNKRVNMKLEDIGFYTLSDERAYKMSRPISPKYVRLSRCELIITDRCNFKCPYCRGLDNTSDVSYDLATDTLFRWSKNGLKNIRFSGGEPTLHPKLTHFVAISKTLGIERIAVSTNGSADLALYKALVELGVNDFSISLDACCSSSGEKMTGVKGAWETVISNIKELSKITYVTIGLVVTPDNLKEVSKTISLASSLGVSDIRIIPAAQYDKKLELNIPQNVLDKHPILRYRYNNFRNGVNVRGESCKKCPLVLDDMAVYDRKHYPCIIYLREKGKEIGLVGDRMMEERHDWYVNHDCSSDPICSKNCLDVCKDYNNRVENFKILR